MFIHLTLHEIVFSEEKRKVIPQLSVTQNTTQHNTTQHNKGPASLKDKRKKEKHINPHTERMTLISIVGEKHGLLSPISFETEIVVFCLNPARLQNTVHAYSNIE